MSKKVVLFTMEGCGACKVLKDELKKNKIDYVDFDIDTHPHIWDQITIQTGIGYVPTVYIVEDNNDNGVTLSPGKDFNDPLEALKKISENL